MPAAENKTSPSASTGPDCNQPVMPKMMTATQGNVIPKPPPKWESLLSPELSDLIWDTCIEMDEHISGPRIVDVLVSWNPSEDECMGCDEDNPRDDVEAHEEEDDEPHMIVYDDRRNFKFKVYDSSQVRRSEAAAKTLLNICKASRSRVHAFWRSKGRARDNFASWQLKRLRISPTHDIFYTDCPTVFEALAEWQDNDLAAAKDVIKMRRFLIKYTTFKGLAVPSTRPKDDFLRDMSLRCGSGVFRHNGDYCESSMTRIFENAEDIYVVPDTLARNTALTNWEPVAAGDGVVGKRVRGVSATEQTVMRAVWDGTNEEFSKLRPTTGPWADNRPAPRVMWYAPELVVYAEDSESEEGVNET